MKDKYKPWSLLKLFETSLISAGIPIILAILQKNYSKENVEKLLWLYTTILLVIFIVFFGRDRWCCSKKDEQIDELEPDALKYRKHHETEFNELKKEIKAMMTTQSSEYKGKHGMQQTDDKLN